MKIEIGESLVLSWLRHAKNCQLVQLNWKPSVASWRLYNDSMLGRIMKETDRRFSEKYGLDLFKKNSSLIQLLQQGEIDALGTEFNKDGVQSLYGIDIAFHEAGLNYGSKEETISRVIKKMVRTAMIIYGYFNVHKAEVIFASPKIHNAINQPMVECVKELNAYFSELNLAFRFSIIGNHDFKSQIFDVVTNLSKSVADTSELFMRSIQMYNLFTDTPTRSEEPVKSERARTTARNDVKGFEGMKVGELVKTHFNRLSQKSLLDQRDIERLMQAEYSKRTFNINYPVLKEYSQTSRMSDLRNVNGYPRYYANTYKFHGKQYLLCNDWYEDKNRSYFIAWLGNYFDRTE